MKAFKFLHSASNLSKTQRVLGWLQTGPWRELRAPTQAAKRLHRGSAQRRHPIGTPRQRWNESVHSFVQVCTHPSMGQRCRLCDKDLLCPGGTHSFLTHWRLRWERQENDKGQLRLSLDKSDGNQEWAVWCEGERETHAEGQLKQRPATGREQGWESRLGIYGALRTFWLRVKQRPPAPRVLSHPVWWLLLSPKLDKLLMSIDFHGICPCQFRKGCSLHVALR